MGGERRGQERGDRKGDEGQGSAEDHAARGSPWRRQRSGGVGLEELAYVEGLDRRRDALDDATAIRSVRHPPTRIDFVAVALQPVVDWHDHGMQWIARGRVRITTASCDSLVRTSEPTGKKVIVLTNVFTSEVLSVSPASRASSRHARSGLAGDR